MDAKEERACSQHGRSPEFGSACLFGFMELQRLVARQKKARLERHAGLKASKKSNAFSIVCRKAQLSANFCVESRWNATVRRWSNELHLSKSPIGWPPSPQGPEQRICKCGRCDPDSGQQEHSRSAPRTSWSMNRGPDGQIYPSCLSARSSIQRLHCFDLPSMPEDNRKEAQ